MKKLQDIQYKIYKQKPKQIIIEQKVQDKKNTENQMSSKQLNLLTEKIKDWNTNLEYFKKMVDRDDGTMQIISHFSEFYYRFTENQKQRLEKTIDNINELSLDIKRKFDSSNQWPHADQVKAQKFEKDFMNKMKIYTNLLTEYKDRKSEQLNQARQSYMTRRQTIQQQKEKEKKRKYSQEQSQGGVQIQLQDVNQQTLFQQHLIQLKEKQLLEVKSKMEKALQVQKQVGKLVNQQGKKIDIIQDNVDTARSNVKEAGTLLEEGVQHHKSATRKKMCIIAIIFIALLVIIIPIMIKLI